MIFASLHFCDGLTEVEAYAQIVDAGDEGSSMTVTLKSTGAAYGTFSITGKRDDIDQLLNRALTALAAADPFGEVE